MTTQTSTGDQITPEGLLRAPFPASQVGLLPATQKRPPLEYVGHGAVTSRLLDVDPGWTWEPFSVDEHGAPAVERDDKGNPVGLWIKLTVNGVTRVGYGDCEPGQFSAIKVLIGDALRNAAMRFGVALDLWVKGHAEDDEQFRGNVQESTNVKWTEDEEQRYQELVGRVKKLTELPDGKSYLATLLDEAKRAGFEKFTTWAADVDRLDAATAAVVAVEEFAAAKAERESQDAAAEAPHEPAKAKGRTTKAKPGSAVTDEELAAVQETFPGAEPVDG